MNQQVIHEPKQEAANTPPKPMINAEIWLKMLADQKLIREELQKALHSKSLEGSMHSSLKPYDYYTL